MVRDGDLDLISQTLDALGANCYHDEVGSTRDVGEPVRAVAPPRPTRTPYVDCDHLHFPARAVPVTGLGWEIHAAGRLDLIVEMAADHRPPPVYVTENGAAFDDNDASP